VCVCINAVLLKRVNSQNRLAGRQHGQNLEAPATDGDNWIWERATVGV